MTNTDGFDYDEDEEGKPGQRVARRQLLRHKADLNSMLAYHQVRLLKLADLKPEKFYEALMRALASDDDYSELLTEAPMKDVRDAYRQARFRKLPSKRDYTLPLKKALTYALATEGTVANVSAQAYAAQAATMIGFTITAIHGIRRAARRRVRMNPIRQYRDKVLKEAEQAAHGKLSWRPKVFIPLPSDRYSDGTSPAKGDLPANGIRVSIGWKRQTEALGSSAIGSRWIAKADLVDQIGEFDLFQVEFYEGSQTHRQHGFVGRYRGTNVRGFGVKPEVALQWTRRQVIIEGQRRLGVLKK